MQTMPKKTRQIGKVEVIAPPITDEEIKFLAKILGPLVLADLDKKKKTSKIITSQPFEQQDHKEI